MPAFTFPLMHAKVYSKRGTQKRAAANLYCIEGHYFTAAKLAAKLGCPVKEATRRMYVARQKDGPVTMDVLKR